MLTVSVERISGVRERYLAKLTPSGPIASDFILGETVRVKEALVNSPEGWRYEADRAQILLPRNDDDYNDFI